MDVLLTGATGFVGKVALVELLRRAEALDIERVYVLARPKTRRDGTVVGAVRRFWEDVATSPAMRDLPAGWQERIQVLEGDLSLPGCGLSESDTAGLAESLTHILHCAASVDFWLPVAEAARANITASLEVLELARRCRRLRHMVSVSTAYVSPHRHDEATVPEALAPLPFDPEQTWRSILAGEADEQALMQAAGLPNTYTLTKCIAEHLLARRRGTVPLSIQRPSVVSAARERPFNGWIDSRAAFGAYLLYQGLGLARTWPASPSCRLDLVPVDAVVDSLIEMAFIETPTPPGQPPRIRHAVAGWERGTRFDLSAEIARQEFGALATGRSPGLRFLGPPEHGFNQKDLLLRALPMAGAKALARLRGDEKQARKLDRVDRTLVEMNRGFYYFSTRGFRFAVERPLDLPDWDPAVYVRQVCRGVYRHLMDRDDREVPLLGKAMRRADPRSKVEWLSSHPLDPRRGVNAASRSLGIGLREVMGQVAEAVTWDRPAFEAALGQVRPDDLVVLAPNHRSYLDFLLLPYLLLDRPELGLPMPRIAAAEEFRRIPGVGPVLEQAGAFFIPRDRGGPSEAVDGPVRQLARDGGSLLVFIEGSRSRDRSFLPPRRGVLRAVQATGRPASVLPIGLSYDRLPDEDALLRELSGEARPKMRVGALARWMQEALSGRIRLGRMHIGVDRPLRLDADTDVVRLATRVMAGMQRACCASSFHLRMFLVVAGRPESDLAWLREALEQRGMRVLDSSLELPAQVDARYEATLRNGWAHAFAGDLLAMGDPAASELAWRLSWDREGLRPRRAAPDPRLEALLMTLMVDAPTAAPPIAAREAGRTLRPAASPPVPAEGFRRSHQQGVHRAREVA